MGLGRVCVCDSVCLEGLRVLRGSVDMNKKGGHIWQLNSVCVLCVCVCLSM